jgi:carboxyl-terminal processing protease
MNNEPQHIKTGLRVALGVIGLVVVFLGGVYVGYQNRPAMAAVTGLVHKEPVGIDTDFNPFWKAWKIVDEKFPGAASISNEDKLYGAIKGLLTAYKDPYTTFFNPEESKVFESEIAGEFSGIGVEIGQKDGVLTVIAPLKNTPADRAGIKAGDKVVKINDTITTDMSVDKAVDIIRGEKGSPVVLTIIREGSNEPKVFTIKRDTIALPTVDTEVKGDVFVIHLYNFSAQSPALFESAFHEYLNSGKTNLLLDLRGNPGGYLEAAVSIGSRFIPEGKIIVKEIGKTDRDVSMHTSRGPVTFPSTHKLMILVDKGSASASEILAGALSEHKIGTLIGEQTFGKGSVQEVVRLTNNTSLKVTVAKWYTPNGVSISDNGLTPAIKVAQPLDAKSDIQLDEAIKLFHK